jgi:DNA repair protein RecN (Recombination protein N)
MLRELRISNLALITELNIEFGPAFTVLTGETGAGKSIILQSINLLYGEPARSWVRSGAENAVVEALFECARDHPLNRLLVEQGCDGDGQIVLKRVVSATGNSRYYVNGGLATGKTVGELAENLVNIASQHDHQQLLSRSFHLDFLDAFAGLRPQRQALGELHDRWSGLRDRCLLLRQREQDKEQRRDFLSFQCREIEEAEIVANEDQCLELEKQRLRATADLARLGGSSQELLTDRVLDALAEIRRNLQQMSGFDPSLENLAENVSEQSFQLEDAAQQLRIYLDELTDEPGRLDEVTARIDTLQKLKRKYGSSLEEVLEYGRQAAAELQQLDELDRELSNLEKELTVLEQELATSAADLSRLRKQAAERLAEAVGLELSALCLEKASFSVDFGGSEHEAGLCSLTRRGWDQPEFLFSANRGEPLKPLNKVASGGELSRLMLALKCLLARHDRVETVIFDEIDAGISGQTAEAVAGKIRELAEHHQVICITHLPQIAAAADAHFTVTKEEIGERTRTTINLLRGEEKVGELARMLDGMTATAKTRAYAKELLAKKRVR